MSTQPYSIHTDVKFPPLQLIDVRKLQQDTKEQWFNQTLCEVNDSVVRLGVLHRTRAPVRSVVLMIENKGVVPTGD
jgi:hypothetical protein